jgi:hypothetical protein
MIQKPQRECRRRLGDLGFGRTMVTDAERKDAFWRAVRRYVKVARLLPQADYGFDAYVLDDVQLVEIRMILAETKKIQAKINRLLDLQ